jgi:hypothetical protein
MPPKPTPWYARAFLGVDTGPGCWESPRKGPKGRPVIQLGAGRGHQLLSRMIYTLFYGPPKGWVLHRCDNVRCIKPSHLYDGTAAQNSKDMMDRGRGKGQFQHGNYPKRWLKP